jgi:hypothetical protein
VGYVACVEHAADKLFDHWISLLYNAIVTV